MPINIKHIIPAIETGVINITLLVTGIMAIIVSVAEMGELVQAKKTDSDLYRTHIASIALATASFTAAAAKMTGSFAIYFLCVVAIVFGAILIGITSKSIDDRKNAQNTDIYRLNILTLVFGILTVIVGVGLLILKIMFGI
jgi:hypothetical protein